MSKAECSTDLQCGAKSSSNVTVAESNNTSYCGFDPAEEAVGKTACTTCLKESVNYGCIMFSERFYENHDGSLDVMM